MALARIAAAALALSTAAPAQEGKPVRIRGTIDKVAGSVVTVKTRDGTSATVKLSDDATVAGVVPASLGDVTPGKFIGTATRGQKDGALVALEVLIFPDSMRGFNEGHFPWDLEPESMMTNATVADVVKGAKDRVLTLKYKDGEKKIYVPENAPIVTFTNADRSALTPGARVFIGAAQRQADGTFATKRINVGLKGLAPPM
ncbi:MAG TPA: hypothetical protein VIV57_11430 [Anaeromyxobacter sp.]